MNDKRYLRIAIKQARISVEKGGFPAGAVVIKNGKIVSKGLSLGGQLKDPTGHSEISAIRKACKKLQTAYLGGAILYASLEPCIMCFSAAGWAGISRIVYGCAKNEDMMTKHYYEGQNNIHEINKNNSKKIELTYIPDFKKEQLYLIKVWEDKSKS